jgi:glutathione S-transferase
MPIQYVSVEEAISRDGLRMVVVGSVPSPWGEAAKGIFHLKKLDWVGVRLVYDNDALKKWTNGELSGPVVFYEKEHPRIGWAEILLLAERLAPEPALLPADPLQKSRVITSCDLFCNVDGLGWARRLQTVHAGLNGQGGFPPRIASYLGKKYGYTPGTGAAAGARARELLGRFAGELRASRGPYYLGDRLTALDIYSATFMGLFQPLPEALCRIDPPIRAALETLDEETRAALDPVLLEHRDMMYEKHLETPLCL